ncbi:MAG: glycine/sarcosine/betaine reductase selenoprotein B family protein [Hyphomicrobiales bacterium]
MTDPLLYIDRTRAYYLALGYDAPYVWAENSDIPFTPLQKPLSDAKIALVTTAALFNPANGDQGPNAPYNGGAKFYTPYQAPVDDPPKTGISHIAYDRKHTPATDEQAWLPLNALKQATADGVIGAVTKHFHGLPTNRSKRTTLEGDAVLLLAALKRDQADAAILVPNCPVCHQSATLAARYLEENGIPTVVMGCAKDIVESAGVPRFIFSDFPLGNGAGKPHNESSQKQTLALALSLLADATAPKTVINPQVWSKDHSWKEDYSNPEKLSAQELADKRAAFDAGKKAAKAVR